MQRGDFFHNLPDAAGSESIEVLSRMHGKDIRVERIVTEVAASDIWYDQNWPEWVLVLKGRAELEFDSPPAEENLGPGEWLLIPANRRHRVRACEKNTIWLAIHADS